MGLGPSSATEGLCVVGKLPNLSEPAVKGLRMEPTQRALGRLEVIALNKSMAKS